MSDRGRGNRGSHTGGRGTGGRGAGRGDAGQGVGSRGGGSGASGARGRGRGNSSRSSTSHHDKQNQQLQPKQSVINVSRFINQKVQVKFSGGMQVVGILKGWDPLLNLVLDETEELLTDDVDENRFTGKSRFLGLLVCRGTNVIVVSPMDGSEEISNPFIAAE